ncbi:MAG: sugar phosphate nucleotidyltransferase [Muribaculaceae bacterium]|nr:sugar phosphate nucleotidyltransferase [Muribaculaceae bacterium]
MKPTLFVLAAGMGSRYGGLKQLDSIGPSGETIMDYSIFDAIRSGFGKVVFVIRHDFEKEFSDKILSKYKNHIPVEVVFQDINNLPKGIMPNPERVKPWGTNHAVLMGKDVINEPFAVINADDFYGSDSFKTLADALKSMSGKKNEYCMVGFHVGNTLSESGEVSRGVCNTDKEGFLSTVTERHHIMRRDGSVSFIDNEDVVSIEDDTLVSMNMWGFTPDYFEYSEKTFVEFLKKNANELKAEFYIPSMVNELIVNGTSTVKVYDTTSSWFGVTYSEDKPTVVRQIKQLVDKGEYPNKLF